MESVSNLAANVRSFLGSLPYVAPEQVEFQAEVKLRQPLAEYDEECDGLVLVGLTQEELLALWQRASGWSAENEPSVTALAKLRALLGDAR
jgi:hypothetical protein